MLPKGPVLGPNLVLIYINDSTNSAPMFEYKFFDDDANIFSNEPQLSKENLKNIEKWCHANKLI